MYEYSLINQELQELDFYTDFPKFLNQKNNSK